MERDLMIVKEKSCEKYMGPDIKMITGAKQNADIKVK